MLSLAAEDIAKPKPDPEVYLKAAKALGVSPKDCVVIEDSNVGLRAAVAAEISCIVVPACYTKSQVHRSAFIH